MTQSKTCVHTHAPRERVPAGRVRGDERSAPSPTILPNEPRNLDHVRDQLRRATPEQLRFVRADLGRQGFRDLLDGLFDPRERRKILQRTLGAVPQHTK
jgi:hypothetical protein